MRDRLIELIKQVPYGASVGARFEQHFCEKVADHLLAAGVIVPPNKGCEYCKGRAYTKRPLTVITKYGRRIELTFEFCPNCGRKMNVERSNENAE